MNIDKMREIIWNGEIIILCILLYLREDFLVTKTIFALENFERARERERTCPPRRSYSKFSQSFLASMETAVVREARDEFSARNIILACRRTVPCHEKRKHNERSTTTTTTIRGPSNTCEYLEYPAAPDIRRRVFEQATENITRARENKLTLSAAMGMTNYTLWWRRERARERGGGSDLLPTHATPSRKLSPANLSHKTAIALQFAHCVNCIKSLSDIWAERRGRVNRKPKICTLIR